MPNDRPTLKNRVSATCSVQGRVFNAVTRGGIVDLVVTVYDLNKGADRSAVDDLGALIKNAIRVGSVLSDETGAFVLNYDQDDIAALHTEKRRLNLLVVVSAPEDENGSVGKVIYFSNPPRTNAGRVENFNIGISHATLKKFGLSDDPNV